MTKIMHVIHYRARKNAIYLLPCRESDSEDTYHWDTVCLVKINFQKRVS